MKVRPGNAKLIKRMDRVFAFLKKQETDLVRPA